MQIGVKCKYESLNRKWTRWQRRDTTGIPRFVRTSNSALSISAQKQIVTTPRIVRIINSISAHVSQLKCYNFVVIWESWRHFCYDAPVKRYQFGWSYLLDIELGVCNFQFWNANVIVISDKNVTQKSCIFSWNLHLDKCSITYLKDENKIMILIEKSHNL